ncbi:MAG: polysaccharide deacetylase family protein [Pseudomonadota bacterium]|nr:polysaccharide deacetylase family protein [Pseudomonadota bacterium]
MISTDAEPTEERLTERLERRITRWWPVRPTRFVRSPVISFSFDDFPHSAWQNGSQILDAAGYHATYYVASAFAPLQMANTTPFGIIEGTRYFELDDLVELHQSDHELACHTANHRRVSRLTTTELQTSLDANARFLSDLLGEIRLDSFAYPQGVVNLRTKWLCTRRFVSCRGTVPGLNTGWFDLGQLKAVALDRDFSIEGDLEFYLDQLKKHGGWLIFYGHDVESAPSQWGCTPETLAAVVQKVAQSGIAVESVGRVAQAFYPA